MHNQRLYVFDEIEAMGFGLNELRLLRNTICEIAYENNTSKDEAFKEFFKFVERTYDVNLKANDMLTTNNSIETFDKYRHKVTRDH